MTTEKFCFCLKLEAGCILLGFTTFLLSVILITFVAIDVLKVNSYLEGQDSNTRYESRPMTLEHKTFDLTLSGTAEEVKSVLEVIFLSLWMLFSVLVIIGILKKKVNLVMTYFLFGIAISIMFMLFGLLQAINGNWPVSVVTIIATLAYIKCLASVYVAYDEMRQDKGLDLEQLINDEEPIIEN